MAEVGWFRVATGVFGNRKVRQIERMSKGDSVLVIWFKLLALAATVNDGGLIYVTPEIPYDDAALADELRRAPALVKQALSALDQLGMVIRREGGHLFIPGWAEHQNIDGLERIREQNRQRKQAQRDRERSRDCHVTGHAESRDCHATEEEEEERKKNSFTHSFACARALGEGENEEISVLSRESAKRECLQGSIGKGVVLMSEEEMDDLLDKLSIDEFNHYVGVIADAELAGKRYKKRTHYQAILDMAEQDRSHCRRR